jgi:hypothetical protein
MKIKNIFATILVVLLSCININAQFADGIRMANNEISKNLDTINSNDFHFKITKINCKTLTNILNSERKMKLIYVYGTWCPTVILSSNIVSKIISEFQNQIEPIIISADFCTNLQVDFLKKFLKSKDLNVNTYIIENNFTSLTDLTEFQTTEHIGNFINCFDKNYKRLKLPTSDGKIMNLSPLPYFCILDKDNKIIFKKVYEIDEEKIKSDNVKPEDFFVLDENEIKQIINKNINK